MLRMGNKQYQLVDGAGQLRQRKIDHLKNMLRNLGKRHHQNCWLPGTYNQDSPLVVSMCIDCGKAQKIIMDKMRSL